jgi:hypothetical protein
MEMEDLRRGRPVNQGLRLSTARVPISWTRRRVLAELLNDGSSQPANVAHRKEASESPRGAPTTSLFRYYHLGYGP